MDKISKRILIFIVFWYILVSIGSFFINMPANVLQIIFSIPIALIGFLSAQKPKSIELIKFEEKKSLNESVHKRSIVDNFDRFYKIVEYSYGHYKKVEPHPQFFSIFNYSIIGATKYKDHNGITTHIKFDFKHEDYAIIAELNPINGLIKLYPMYEEQSILFEDYSERKEFYKKIKKKYAKFAKIKIPKLQK